MREKKDSDIVRLMTVAMAVIIAVLAVVILGFKFLQQRQEREIVYAKNTSQEAATSGILEAEYPSADSAAETTADQEEAVNGARDENADSEDIYLIKGEEKKSDKYERTDKLAYTDSVRYTMDDLKLLDRYGLRITRNEIFARHGRMFNDQELQKYFDNQPWYVPKYSPSDFDDSCLNEVEVDNVNLIMSYEVEQGYQ